MGESIYSANITGLTLWDVFNSYSLSDSNSNANSNINITININIGK